MQWELRELKVIDITVKPKSYETNVGPLVGQILNYLKPFLSNHFETEIYVQPVDF